MPSMIPKCVTMPCMVPKCKDPFTTFNSTPSILYSILNEQSHLVLFTLYYLANGTIGVVSSQ